jgi:hypothetical protein
MSRYDIDKKPQSLAELEPMILAAQAELSAICNGKRWRMSIPVQDDDSDMVIGDALRHSLAFVRAVLQPQSEDAERIARLDQAAKGFPNPGINDTVIVRRGDLREQLRSCANRSPGVG